MLWLPWDSCLRIHSFFSSKGKEAVTFPYFLWCSSFACCHTLTFSVFHTPGANQLASRSRPTKLYKVEVSEILFWMNSVFPKWVEAWAVCMCYLMTVRGCVWCCLTLKTVQAQDCRRRNFLPNGKYREWMRLFAAMSYFDGPDQWHHWSIGKCWHYGRLPILH